MSSSSTTRDGNSENPLPGFYKRVDHSLLEEKKLAIPEKICESLEALFPIQCVLKTYAGFWHVDLKRIRGGFFFTKGWKEFVCENDLKLGEHIVFDYTGHGEFYVEIFAKNQYQCCRTSMESDPDSEMSPTSQASLESGIKSPRKSAPSSPNL